jgi:hypothetical protein
MISFTIYWVTPMATVVPVLVLITFAVWGRPISLLELISLAGSVSFGPGAFVSLYRRRASSLFVLASAFAPESTPLGPSRLIQQTSRAGSGRRNRPEEPPTHDMLFLQVNQSCNGNVSRALKSNNKLDCLVGKIDVLKAQESVIDRDGDPLA